MFLGKSRAMLFQLLMTIIVLCSVRKCLPMVFDEVKRFETLMSADVQFAEGRTQRDTHGVHEISMKFSAYGQNFHAKLQPSSQHQNNKFKVRHYSNGRTRSLLPHEWQNVQLLTGSLLGEPNSKAVVYRQGNSIMGTFIVKEEIFTIEDAAPHGLTHVHYVVYRDADLRRVQPICNTQMSSNESHSHAIVRRNSEQYSDEYHHSVAETSGVDLSPTQKRCPIRLVADHKYFMTVGEGDLQKTIDKVVAQIERVNLIFQGTKFVDANGNGYFNMGFMISEVFVFEEPTPPPSADSRDHKHFNIADKVTSGEMLYSFSRDETEAEANQWACLAHLFTARNLDHDALGLAHIGSKYEERGICARPQTELNTRRKFVDNCGLSTSIVMGKRILTRISDITVAHELAHGWGAEHDPDTETCIPSDRNGGPYIMNAYANNARNRNNATFSPCTIRQVMDTLSVKSRCFIDQTIARCGNMVRDDDEECDVGSISDDPCCSSGCQLRDGAQCSDRNDLCCRHCRPAPEGYLCRSKFANECLDEARCSGVTERCPVQKALPDNSTCADRGVCRNGHCAPYCETLGLTPCLCHGKKACLRCCQKSQNSTCMPIEPNEYLSDGTLCHQGFCKNHRCVKQVQDVVERFLTIISEVNPSWLLRTLQQYSTPLTILALSMIWIPVGVFLHCYDKRNFSFANSVPVRHSSCPRISSSSTHLTFPDLDLAFADDDETSRISMYTNIHRHETSV